MISVASKFQDFLAKPEKEKPEPLIIDGMFSCQTCNTYVYEAKLYQTEKLLVWKDEAGHVSFVEDFGL